MVKYHDKLLELGRTKRASVVLIFRRLKVLLAALIIMGQASGLWASRPLEGASSSNVTISPAVGGCDSFSSYFERYAQLRWGITAATTTKFIYDGWPASSSLGGGWNCIAEVNASGTLTKSYLWGSDLSGSMGGAGGVGGLLMVDSITQGQHFVGMDGNGNVALLVDAATGITSALYDYGPFGETLRATGSMAKVNRYQFSTKYFDIESGLGNWGYRLGNVSTGKWLSRDPLEEQGGVNITAIAGNDLVNHWDYLGLAESQAEMVARYFQATQGEVPQFPLVTTTFSSNFADIPRASLPPQLSLNERANIEAFKYKDPDLYAVLSTEYGRQNAAAHKDIERAKQARETLSVFLCEQAALGLFAETLAPFRLGERALSGLLRFGDEGLAGAAKEGATFGRAASTDYRGTFFAANPELEGQVVVHHAVEQQTLTRFPGLVSEAEIHSLENLRGIPKAINSDVHLSQIRVEWNQFYRANPNPSQAQLLQKATEIDTKFGSQFQPPR